VNLIENLTNEHSEELDLEAECEFKLESEEFNLNQIVNSAVNWASSLISLNLELTNLTPIEFFPPLELKVLPKHLASQVRLSRWTRDPSSHHRVPYDCRARRKSYVSS